MAKSHWWKKCKKLGIALSSASLAFGALEAAMAEPAQAPLFLTQPVKPIAMLNMSRDHQLYFKLFDDYSDLTDPLGGEPDGTPDTTYVHKYQYYGYFDSTKCYDYDSTKQYFEPTHDAGTDGYCDGGGTGEWSGNFLNWATMTRMDAVRKVLYGGKRYIDDENKTVLERAFLPEDAHAFAKYYNGSDIQHLTPFSVTHSADSKDSGITICNATSPTGDGRKESQWVTSPPLLKVAQGNYSLWASNERWQCRWGVNSNGNDATKSGIKAYSDSPQKSGDNGKSLGLGDYVVRVEVCVPGLISDENVENCREYADGNSKPAGLLQEYGESGEFDFGLMTGSYGANKSGGVLRKQVGSMDDEIDAETGQFKSVTNSIIGTLDAMRIYGYDYGGGTYNNSGDNCDWGMSAFNNGRCTNWGNPQSEMFLESLRYLAGAGTATAAFNVDDSGRISGLNTASWNDPINNDNYCANLNIIQFNASTSSYDHDELGGASAIGITDLDQLTDAVAAAEGISGQYFVGTSGASNDQLCTPKSVTGLSNVTGTCPDAPRLNGSYQIAGLAYHARKNGIAPQRETVTTYGVALAPALPKIDIPVPAGNGKKVTILPACRNHSTSPDDANCAIVDFKVVSQSSTSSTRSGTLYVNWEDSEQGGDYDQDMWGIIKYEVSSSQVKIKTQVVAQSTPNSMGFGYIVGGTTSDGFKVHSGINNFVDDAIGGYCKDSNCTCRSSGQGACNQATETEAVYSIGSSSAKSLQLPLYYAAKWGGYSEDFATVEEIQAADPETYFFATDPRELAESLAKAFDSIASKNGSASAVSTNSTRLREGSLLYQAQFHSGFWSGEILAYRFNDYGDLTGSPITTNDTLNTATVNPATRKIYTFTGGTTPATPVEFRWSNLSAAQKLALGEGNEASGQKRVNWLRGEQVSGLRERHIPDGKTHEVLLGDIVSSSPTYLGGRDMRYDRLPGDAGTSYRTWLQDVKRKRDPLLFVGANDGMLHAFDANTMEEKWAYVPAGVYSKLANVTKPNYGEGGSGNPHQYLVNGPIGVGDAYINGKWTSIVVGTLGAGGKGVFALDVSGATPKVIFELNNDGSMPLGYVLGQPYIVPLKNGKNVQWAAVFANGYEAGSTRLYWVDLENPSSVNTLIAEETNGTGLSAPALLPNGQGIVEAAYAGDLSGNMWKFDLYNTNQGKWGVKKLFTAKTSSGDPQPITGAPELGVNSQRDHALMVYFGTGRYAYNADNTTSIPTQAFYAVIDDGRRDPVSPDALFTKTIQVIDGKRRVTDSGNWTDYDGWRMELPTAGERVTTKPILLHDKLIFVTIIPSAIPCEFGGRSWIMEVPAIGDKYVNHTTLGENVQTDTMVLGEIGLGLLDPPPENDDETDGGDNSSGGGSGCEEGQFPARVYALGSDGDLISHDGCLDGGTLGRMSWRQVQ